MKGSRDPETDLGFMFDQRMASGPGRHTLARDGEGIEEGGDFPETSERYRLSVWRSPVTFMAPIKVAQRFIAVISWYILC